MQAKIDIFSKLLRELETELGTHDVAKLVLQSLIESVKGFKGKDVDDFCEQFARLEEIISSTEPKFGILNYHFLNLRELFDHEIKSKTFDVKKWKHLVIKSIEKILKKSNQEKEDLIGFADRLNIEGKTILIHDHSHTVQDVLAHYKNQGKNFKVVIAEQDFEKTHSNIERMHAAGIPFEVVPAYMLSHVHEQIDMLFFGALTLKDTMNFVMDPGTHSIISEFNVVHVPVYMFIGTSKFSLWKSKKRSEIFIHRHTRKHHAQDIEYERIKYSHDRVPAELFAKIVTNKGIFTPTKLEVFFDEMMTKFGKKE